MQPILNALTHLTQLVEAQAVRIISIESDVAQIKGDLIWLKSLYTTSVTDTPTISANTPPPPPPPSSQPSNPPPNQSDNVKTGERMKDTAQPETQP